MTDFSENEKQDLPEEVAENPADKSSLWKVMLFSFFVVPMFIAIAGVGVFSGAYWLISDAPDALNLLDDVRHSYSNKRWQAAYHLVSMFEGPNAVEVTPEITRALQDAFEESASDNEMEVRQYLALAMGCTGEADFVIPLLEALSNDPVENTPFLIRALGRLGDDRAAEAIATYLEDTNVTIRLESAVALGAMGNTTVKPALTKALNDSEPNVRWDAAIALAKLGDTGGAATLLQLLDRAYLAGFEEVDEKETHRILQVVVQVAAGLHLNELDGAIKMVAAKDPNMAVRQAAQQALDYHKNNKAAQAAAKISIVLRSEKQAYVRQSA